MTHLELNEEYEKWIDIINSQLKVFSHVSCQRIFVYLRICGKKTAADLMDYLKYSRAAIYTAVNLLLEAQYIKKERDPTIKDKRKNVYYYAIEKDFVIIDDENFVNYVIKRNKLKIYLKWLKNSVKMSTSMIDEIYKVVISSKIARLKQLEKNDGFETSLSPDEKKSIITYSEIGSITNQQTIVAKILDFLKELENDFTISEPSKNSITNPALFSLFYIPL